MSVAQIINLSKGGSASFVGVWGDDVSSPADLSGTTVTIWEASPELEDAVSIEVTSPPAGQVRLVVVWKEGMDVSPVGGPVNLLSFRIRMTPTDPDGVPHSYGPIYVRVT